MTRTVVTTRTGNPKDEDGGGGGGGKSDFAVLEGTYLLHETIGRGGFAKVKKATHVLTGERVAIKILDKQALGDDLPRVHREIETLKTLNHPHICKMFQVMETQNKIFIVMEYCRGGELFDYIVQKDRLQEDEARRIFRQIAAAIVYVHRRGIAHRDLKPENILLDADNNVKLIDFGLCAALKTGLNAELETCCGSPAYAAPELVRGQRYIGTLADVWSLGVLLYALLCGTLPFDDPCLGALYRKIQNGKYDEPRWLSEGSKNILRCMLQTNPEFRVPVDQLLNHTWCQEGKLEPLPVGDLDQTKEKEKGQSLDIDVLRVMASHAGLSVQNMEIKVSKFEYGTQELATYLILQQRKELVGARSFRIWGINIDRTPIMMTNRVQKSLDSELLACEGDEVIPTTPARHASMEGGLENSHLLTIGSPKILMQNEDDDDNENKENVDLVDFVKPKIPTQGKKLSSTKMPDTPTPAVSEKQRLSPARSAECVMKESLRTPVRPYSPCGGRMASPSPARRKVLGSLERGLDKVRNMLTPRTNKTKKQPRALATYGKGANNVSTTRSTDAESVISELKASLAAIGMGCKQKGYRLISTTNKLKFELEVVHIEDLNVIGIRRKRVGGDSWAYKRIMDTILSSNVAVASSKTTNPTPSTPLQTTV